MIDDTTLNPEPQQHVDTGWNEITRRYERIDLQKAGLAAGQRVLRLYWCESGQRYVTVPGASLYVVGPHGDLIPE